MRRINIKKDFIGTDSVNYVLLDGQILNKVSVEKIRSSKFQKSWYCIYSEMAESSKKIASLKISDYTNENIYVLVLMNWAEIGIYSINVRFEIDTENIEKNYLKFELWADLLLWNRNYTFIDYLTEFEHLLNSSKIGVLTNDNVETAIKVKIEIITENKVISEEINNNLKKVIDHHYLTLKNLDANFYNNSILATFNFPIKLRSYCEQYLLYFAQFLQDLGINASSNLEEKAGKVLFSVTPTDDNEALDRIREALAIYLNLPASPIIYDDSFAAMRLQQQIENLQHSQKMAARELQFNEKLLVAQSDIIREKDLLISQKDSTIEQQQKIIEKITSKSIMVDSLENKEEIEEIYEGIKVSESKWLRDLTGIGLNPAKAIKTAVKNSFGKDEKKSILGLEED